MTIKTWQGTGSGTTTNPKSGNWGVSSAWSPAGAPAAGDDIVLNAAGSNGPYTVTLNVSTNAVDSVSIGSGATVAVTTNTLNVNGTGSGATDTVTVSSGGTLSVAGGTVNATTISDAGTVSGFGTINSAMSGGGALTASGGTLEVKSGITGTLAMTVGGGATDRLKLDGTSAATSLTFSGSTGTIELNTSGTLTLTSALSVGANTVQLDGSSSHLTDNAGISLSTGTITGLGLVTGAITASGAAHITANGGTLEIASGITDNGSALVLTVTGASDRLLLDGAGAAHTVTFSSSGTLELNTSGTLTVGTQVAIGSGTLKLDVAGTVQFTDAAGVTLSGGTISGTGLLSSSTNVTGSGTLAISFTGSNTITASGGTLDVTGSVTSSQTLAIANVASSRLKLDHSGVTVKPISITSSNQTLEIAQSATISGAQTVTNGTLTVDTGATLTDTSGITLSGGTLSGAGAISSSTHVTGNGTVGLTVVGDTVTASGGTLDVTGNMDATTVFAVNSGATLKIDHSAVTIAPITVGSGATLEIAQNATINAAQTVSGTLTVDTGAALTDVSGIMLSGGALSGAGSIAANTNVSGAGTVSLGISTAGSITAAGGTLDLTGTVSGRTLAISSASTSVLKIDGTVTTGSAIAINDNHQTLEIGAAGHLTINAAESITNGTIQLDGGTLTDASGVTIGSGATLTGTGTAGAITLAGGAVTQSGGTLSLTSITGRGTVNGVTGAGTITASGGTLDLTGTITGATLAIDTVAGSHLTIDGTVSTANAITLNNTNQTLEIGGSHALTINADESYSGGTLQIDSGGTLTIGSTHTLTIGNGATLTDNGGTITTSGGGGIVVNGTLIGTGTINGPLSGSGIVEASGGTLHLTTAISSGNYDIAASSVLQADSTIASNSIQFLFLSAANGTELGLSNHAGLGAGNTDTISGLNVGTGGAETNFIDLESGGFLTVSHVTYGPGNTSGTVTLSDGTVLNLTGIANGSSGWFADTVSDGAGGTNVFLSDTVCFMPGTRVLTPEGEIAVEALKAGDLVTTADGKAMPIRWLGRQTVSRLFADPLKVLPVRIKEGALGDHTPSRDLLVSPDHALLVDGVLIQAGALVNGTSIVRETAVPERFTYYHVELADHSLILAENTPAETFIDNIDRMTFDNWGEHAALSDAAQIEIVEMAYPRAKAYRQVPSAIRSRLAERALSLAGLSQVA